MLITQQPENKVMEHFPLRTCVVGETRLGKTDDDPTRLTIDSSPNRKAADDSYQGADDLVDEGVVEWLFEVELDVVDHREKRAAGRD
jgi:hypothetical protein